MRLPPVEVLLSWPAPNYVNPVTRGNALLIINIIFITLVALTVGLRLYTRLVIKRWFGLDDVFIILALICTIGLTTVVLLANQNYGWNKHVWDIPFSQFAPTLKIAMAAKCVFTAAATFTRLSLHCFYYRLIKDSNRAWFKWLVHLNVVYTVAIFISFMFLAIFQCNPVRNYWIVGAPPDSCVDEGVVTLIAGIINCVADFATTVTPMPLVFQLMLPRRQRIAISILFGLGFIVTIAGIVRTWFIYKSLIKEYDQTWYAYPLWIAAAIEIDLGVICASAPVLKPLLAKIPFCLTETIKKSAGYFSKDNTGVSGLSSRNAPNVSSGSSSKRRSNAILAAPELEQDRGKSYELKPWDDVEGGSKTDGKSLGSQDAILDGEGVGASKGVKGMWKKLRTGEKKPQANDDMTITRTSEFELQVEPASTRNSMRSSYQPKAKDNHKQGPSLPQSTDQLLISRVP